LFCGLTASIHVFCCADCVGGNPALAFKRAHFTAKLGCPLALVYASLGRNITRIRPALAFHTGQLPRTKCLFGCKPFLSHTTASHNRVIGYSAFACKTTNVVKGARDNIAGRRNISSRNSWDIVLKPGQGLAIS
jgi:hypothetical protein